MEARWLVRPIGRSVWESRVNPEVSSQPLPDGLSVSSMITVSSPSRRLSRRSSHRPSSPDTHTLPHTTLGHRTVKTGAHKLTSRSLKVTGEQPAQPVGSTRATQAVRVLAARFRLVSFSPACSPRRHCAHARLVVEMEEENSGLVNK